MFTLISAECVPLTKELAEDHFSMEPSPTERGLDPARLEYLRKKAEHGELVTFHWARAKISDRMVRINGQHSSTMLQELNGNFPEGLMVHMDTYKVDKFTDLAVLFRQFDSRKSSRSPADISGACQGLYPDLNEVPRDIGKLSVEGIAFYEKLKGLRSAMGDDQYTLFDNALHHPFIRWMGELHSIKTPEMKRVPVAAAMYATFITNELEARKFWAQVARGGVDFEENAPSTILDLWLKECAKRRDKSEDLKDIKQGNYYQGCIFAWNAFRDGKSPKVIKYTVEKGMLEPTH